MISHIEEEFEKLSLNFIQLKAQAPVINEAANICIQALKNGNKILFCGNGGSAADSQHLAAELVCKYKKERAALEAIALTTNTSVLTAAANDLAFDYIFERQVEAFGKKDDVLFALSTSGKSINVVRAVERANELGLTTIALTGADGGSIKYKAKVTIKVPSDITNNIQEMHIAVGHIICEIIEKELFN